jgi:hypothetical protein
MSIGSGEKVMTPAAKEGLPAVVGELVACPFCGGAAAINQSRTTDRDFIRLNHRDIGYGVNCTGCGANNRVLGGMGYATQEAAAASWNRRYPLSALTAEAGKDVALNTMHVKCHEAANAFWNYWNANGETHRHGYYESTWGAINHALRVVGVVPYDYGNAPAPNVRGSLGPTETPPNPLAPSTATPAGEWVLVPREPTEAMRQAMYMAQHYDMSVQNPDEWGAVDKAYAAMLAASPRGASAGGEL